MIVASFNFNGEKWKQRYFYDRGNDYFVYRRNGMFRTESGRPIIRPTHRLVDGELPGRSGLAVRADDQFPGSNARKLSSPANNYLSGSFPHW
jgi:hypothetical protein